MTIQCIAIVKKILGTCLGWFEDIMSEAGLIEVWVALIVLSAVFSVILVPLRGGSPLSLGGLTDFARNKVNRHRYHSDD